MATMSTMMRCNAALGGLGQVQADSMVRRSTLRGNFKLGVLRATGGRNQGLNLRNENVQEAFDKATKTEITEEQILRNQAENESEKRSVFGSEPSSGSYYPRPEIERRPETGRDTDIGSIFAFDGAIPETVNGRLAMVGLVWALFAERLSGLTVYDQLYTQQGGLGLVWYLAIVQIITFASVIPVLNAESTDARHFGPFRAKAERWNGRLAMIGFLSLLLTEQVIHAPVFASWF